MTRSWWTRSPATWRNCLPPPRSSSTTPSSRRRRNARWHSVAQRLPAHVRLLVASQHNPVFSTSRLRLAGVITELRAGDLAFTQVEVEQLLELAGLGREPIDGRRLRSLTEGWPAGLQMAVLAMRAGRRPARGDRRLRLDDEGDERLPGQRGHEPAAARPGRLLDADLRPGRVRRRALPGAQRPG